MSNKHREPKKKETTIAELEARVEALEAHNGWSPCSDAAEPSDEPKDDEPKDNPDGRSE